MKDLSSVDFYRVAVLNAYSSSDLVFIARHIIKDVALTSEERSYLMSLANHIYGCWNDQRDIYSVL